jgi:hypothetical protein
MKGLEDGPKAKSQSPKSRRRKREEEEQECAGKLSSQPICAIKRLPHANTTH